MTKTLKTFINTGLFMLFVCHSHGLALVYNLADVINQTDSGSTNLLDNTTHPGFNGIDDTFDGSIIFNFTITYHEYPSDPNNIHALFQFFSPMNDVIELGAFQSENWQIFKWKNDIAETLTFGSNPFVEGQSQEFTMTIDYNAGALDTGTLMIAGDSTVYDIGDYNYSFEQIVFITGDGNDVSATNMSVEIVPEPETYALISGALALVFVALRRRFNA